ncbi:MAG TPA: PTS sugar transporter subunit IIA [candidate division Zixibacteria bacterium]|nr:PTS sugar transporter subunit IIA [candidate division Zixibacteria bacterium]
MVTDFLSKRGIKIPLDAQTKPEVLVELVDLLCDIHELDSRSEIIDAVLEREELMSTGVGYGIAIPHAKLDFISSSKLVGGISATGIDFDSVDMKPAKIFFLLISPRNGSGDHVRILSGLSRILHSPEVREEVINSTSAEEIIAILKRHDE